jgi:hypothetical protein
MLLDRAARWSAFADVYVLPAVESSAERAPGAGRTLAWIFSERAAVKDTRTTTLLTEGSLHRRPRAGAAFRHRGRKRDADHNGVG